MRDRQKKIIYIYRDRGRERRGRERNKVDGGKEKGLVPFVPPFSWYSGGHRGQGRSERVTIVR